MIVEGQGMGFWTRVRLPSGPLDTEETNPCPISKIAVCRNVVCFVLSLKVNDVPKRATTRLTFQDVQDWVMREHGQKISKSSITQVKAKCGLSGLNTGIKGVMPNVSSNKEKLVLEAFKAFELV